MNDLAIGDLDDNPDADAYIAHLRSTHPHIGMPWIASGADQGSF
jgi:hypothetical protein